MSNEQNKPSAARVAARTANIDYDWWDKNGRSFKSKTTRAVRLVRKDPAKALKAAEELFAIMDRRGYPDNWHRVQRLKEDAEHELRMQSDKWASTKTASMTRTAGEVRFIKDRGGDEKNFAWAQQGPSERDLNVAFEFDGSKLKPLAKTLRSTLMALGHVQSAYHDFTKIKSAQISPDGNLGGKGYIQRITEMRRQYMNVSEALSSLSDTIYDEINAPHWNPTASAEDDPRERKDVAEIMDDVEEIREDPEGFADEMEEDLDGHGKTAASRRDFEQALQKERKLKHYTKDTIENVAYAMDQWAAHADPESADDLEYQVEDLLNEINENTHDGEQEIDLYRDEAPLVSAFLKAMKLASDKTAAGPDPLGKAAKEVGKASESLDKAAQHLRGSRDLRGQANNVADVVAGFHSEILEEIEYWKGSEKNAASVSNVLKRSR